METLSAASARRIALAAQGFGASRPDGPISSLQIRRTVERLNLLQIDSVNVVSRAHYLPLFSRLGAYPRKLLEDAAWGRPRRLFEYWAHEASLLPHALQPLLRWRMARAERGLGVWSRLRPFATERRPEADLMLERIKKGGPLSASDLEGARGEGGWWGWSDAKSTLEWLFWAGRITTATRRNSFERVYDLTERVLPADIVHAPTPDEPDAHRALLAHAARALGIATASDLRDYFRQSPGDANPRLPELVETGEIIPVQVKGWLRPAYLHHAARKPRRIQTQALLAPFDPVVWERSRTERLFDFRFRLEIYTPADKRQHGYYVLPFLMDERLVARVDLKADRAASALRVQAAHAERGAPAETAERLLGELQRMADWLELDRVVIIGAGDLGPALGTLVA